MKLTLQTGLLYVFQVIAARAVPECSTDQCPDVTTKQTGEQYSVKCFKPAYWLRCTQKYNPNEPKNFTNALRDGLQYGYFKYHLYQQKGESNVKKPDIQSIVLFDDTTKEPELVVSVFLTNDISKEPTPPDHPGEEAKTVPRKPKSWTKLKGQLVKAEEQCYYSYAYKKKVSGFQDKAKELQKLLEGKGIQIDGKKKYFFPDSRNSDTSEAMYLKTD